MACLSLLSAVTKSFEQASFLTDTSFEGELLLQGKRETNMCLLTSWVQCPLLKVAMKGKAITW